MSQPTTAWWQRSVVYQIYPRSFCDSNGDGVGDIPGITSKLDHLQALGVDVVWLSPVYQSPNDDNGYDISDYRQINPEFGTMADFETMLAAMHQRGIKLMMDLVVNHTSDAHAWFEQARTSRDNPYHDHYVWADAVDGREPTNWESFFSGSAWQWNAPTGEYYLHLFSKRQPDLNWENPQVRREVYDLMRFWLDKGVDGFRMDVINLISKTWGADGRLPDAPVQRPGFLQSGFELTANGPRLLEFLGEMRREVLDHYDCITVGECPGVSLEVARAITHQDTGSLNMVFQFDHMSLDQQSGQSKWALKDLDLRDLKQSLTHWQLALAEGGWNSLYFNNHDQPRVVSRFGNDGPWRVESAKMLATALHGLQGTPYVYQGEEIGMTNYPFERIEQCQDIETLNMVKEAVGQRGEDPAVVMRAIRTKGRDNARTPMQWTPGPQAGFTSGQPWLAVNPNHDQINAQQAQADAGSVFHHYRHLIGLRRRSDTLVHGRYQALWPDHPQLMAYTRTLGHEQILVLCNFSDQPLQQPLGGLSLSGAVVLSANWPVDGSLSPVVDGAMLNLRPYEGLMLQTRHF